jgi:hypothetical protein
MGFVQSEKSKNNEPKLMSAVRIMMSGGNRDFQFDKTGIKSGNIAEFVANVESTCRRRVPVVHTLVQILVHFGTAK